MRALPQYLGPLITESWLRRYQVLPGRTHPTMSTSGTGGYLLHATKVIDDPTAASYLQRRPKKKPKTENADEEANTSTAALADEKPDATGLDADAGDAETPSNNVASSESKPDL
jgi:tRNA (adenine-N(1)-)-methyltransferase non-catalytic subunit